MKIDQYCQRQRCKHVEFERFRQPADWNSRLCSVPILHAMYTLRFSTIEQATGSQAKLSLGQMTALSHSRLLASVFKKYDSMRIGVTSLTFRGHMTSSLT